MSPTPLRQRLSPLYQRLYQTATIGALNPFLKPVHSGLIGLELAVNWGLDALLPHEPPHPHLNERVTMLVKTFMRPRTLYRLLTSVRRFYPALPIIVVDDSPDAQPIPGSNIETVILPYDSGLSVGRMEGLKQVETPYILLLDDDFVFYRHTRLGQALDLMQQHPTIDIMGGAVVNLPFFTTADYQQATVYPTAAAPTYPPGTHIGGLPTLDKVANFFFARTDRLRLVEWDAIGFQTGQNMPTFSLAPEVYSPLFTIEISAACTPAPPSTKPTWANGIITCRMSFICRRSIGKRN